MVIPTSFKLLYFYGHFTWFYHCMRMLILTRVFCFIWMLGSDWGFQLPWFIRWSLALPEDPYQYFCYSVIPVQTLCIIVYETSAVLCKLCIYFIVASWTTIVYFILLHCNSLCLWFCDWFIYHICWILPLLNNNLSFWTIWVGHD